MSELNQANKRLVWDFWQALEGAETADFAAVAATVMAEDVAIHGPDPINELAGIAGFVTGYWQPLLQSFPDLRRQTHLFMGGRSNGRIDGDITQDGFVHEVPEVLLGVAKITRDIHMVINRKGLCAPANCCFKVG